MGNTLSGGCADGASMPKSPIARSRPPIVIVRGNSSLTVLGFDELCLIARHVFPCKAHRLVLKSERSCLIALTTLKSCGHQDAATERMRAELFPLQRPLCCVHEAKLFAAHETVCNLAAKARDLSLLDPSVEGDYGIFHAHEGFDLFQSWHDLKGTTPPTGIHAIIYMRSEDSCWECAGSCCGGKGLRMRLKEEHVGEKAWPYPTSWRGVAETRGYELAA